MLMLSFLLFLFFVEGIREETKGREKKREIGRKEGREGRGKKREGRKEGGRKKKERGKVKGR